MAEEFIYTNYSVEDIERYLAGSMTAKGMHELERAALKDPFLADAIEGYRDASFVQTYQHLEEISEAILSEKQPAKIVVMPVKTNYWWRVAAIIGVVVIVGGGIWYAAQDHNLNKEKIASLMPVKTKDSLTVASVQNIADSTAVPTNATKKEVTDKKNGKDIMAHTERTNEKKTIVEKVVSSESVKTASASVVDKQQDVSAYSNAAPASRVVTEVMKSVPSMSVDSAGALAMKEINGAALGISVTPAPVNANNYVTNNVASNRVSPSGPYANQTNNFTGNLALTVTSAKPAKLEGFVRDDNKLPLSNVLIYADKGRQTTVTDNKGYFRLNTNDSQLTAMVSSAGYETKQVVLKKNAPNYLVISQLSAYLAGIEVIELKNKIGTKKLAGDSLFPEGGWQSFQEYVYKKLHKEKEMDTTGAGITPIFGSVEIEFTVDDNGIARDLKITKSLDQQSDAEAMKVVQQWPKWIATKKDKKGKIVIQF